MSAFQSFLSALKADRHPFAPGTASFPTLDTEKLQRDLRLAERGHERGKAELPPSGEQAFDTVEQEVVSSILKLQGEAAQVYADNMDVYAQRLSHLDVRQQFATIRTLARNTTAEFNTQVLNDKNELYIARRNVTDAEHQFEDFRQRHGLRRIAVLPQSKVWVFAVIVFCALLETIFNARFFTETAEQTGREIGGWIGGLQIAVLITVMNISLGLGFGAIVLRQLQHRNLLRKAFFVLVLLAYPVLLLAGNFLAAHFRDAFVVDPATAGNAAVSLLIDRQWRLDSFSSYGLVFVGIVVSLISLYEGFRFDDPYPGFGSVSRQREIILNEYAATKRALHEELATIKDQGLAEIEELKAQVRSYNSEYAAVLQSRQSHVQKYQAHLAHLQSAANTLLAVYRGANAKARTTPAPAHFATGWVPGWEVPIAPRDPDGEARERFVNQTVQEVSECSVELVAAYDAAIRQYDLIDNLVHGQKPPWEQAA